MHVLPRAHLWPASVARTSPLKPHASPPRPTPHALQRAACLETLAGWGFGPREAEAAADATGCDAKRATRLLFDREPCTGFQPVEISE